MRTPPPRPFPRRSFLQSAVAGSLLFPGVVRQLLADSGDPLTPFPAQFPAKAKRVIFLFMTGGVSHVDTFDPKPALTRDHGKEIKADHPEIKNRPGYERIFLTRPQWEFAPHGQCGTEVSTLFPHVATCVNQLALIRSLHKSHSNHYNATLGMHTGSFAFGRPSLGSWVSCGLGAVNRNLPYFVVIAPKQTYAGTQVYANDFLPGAHQGTLVVRTTEFGRTPFNNTADAKGHEHHPWAFSSWLAGAGVQRGIVHGATEERPARRRATRPRPRFPRHHSAPHGLRSRTPHLPPRRPRLPAHRRLWA